MGDTSLSLPRDLLPIAQPRSGGRSRTVYMRSIRQGRTQVGKKGWRNLHEHSAPEVAVELGFDAGSDGESAKEPVTVRRIWYGDGLEESRAVVEEAGQATGEVVHDVIDSEQLSLYRPFLPDQLLNPPDDTALSPGVQARAGATLLRLGPRRNP
ncbi:hypothetical protein ABT373_11290 [Streptomyces sp. NPDC000070]|uniref:hypothetical protein n=1 Tax=Streptomyces sp. NPDC000070 TaxID=3154240 RepID=UPI00332D97D9